MANTERRYYAFRYTGRVVVKKENERITADEASALDCVIVYAHTYEEAWSKLALSLWGRSATQPNLSIR